MISGIDEGEEMKRIENLFHTQKFQSVTFGLSIHKPKQDSSISYDAQIVFIDQKGQSGNFSISGNSLSDLFYKTSNKLLIQTNQ